MFPTVTLKVVEGPHTGKELVFPAGTSISLGRSSDSTFQLQGLYEDLLVSRHHCRIDIHADWVEIRDLESRNGTWINGARIGFPEDDRCADSTIFKRRLEEGDQIRIGMSVLEVSFASMPAAAPGEDHSEMLAASGVSSGHAES